METKKLAEFLLKLPPGCTVLGNEDGDFDLYRKTTWLGALFVKPDGTVGIWSEGGWVEPPHG